MNHMLVKSSKDELILITTDIENNKHSSFRLLDKSIRSGGAQYIIDIMTVATHQIQRAIDNDPKTETATQKES